MTGLFWKMSMSVVIFTGKLTNSNFNNQKFNFIMKMLKNKVAIVTGTNRGIGLEVARTFVANGAQVLAGMRKYDYSAINKITASIIEGSGGVTDFLIDLADDVSIKNALRAIHNSTNKVDILVNNAGIASGGLFQMTSIAELRRLFEVNFFGQILFTQGISRIMARNKSGSIINITSSAASIPEIGTLAYGSSKAAFSRATESMAKELGDNGIRVNAIAPGLIETDMYEQMSPEGRDRLISRAAIKRAGKPEDVANIALFLASDLSQFMTGQVLSVDGGLT